MSSKYTGPSPAIFPPEHLRKGKCSRTGTCVYTQVPNLIETSFGGGKLTPLGPVYRDLCMLVQDLCMEGRNTHSQSPLREVQSIAARSK